MGGGGTSPTPTATASCWRRRTPRSAAEPDFLVGNVPPEIDPTLSESGFELSQPRLYFGEGLDDYVVVGTDRDEIDFQDEDNETQTTALRRRADGVPANSLLRRAAFALRFGDLNPLISDFMTDDSKVIYIRDVVDRVRSLAPFLDADADPYPVVIDGAIVWVVDLYTTTDRYPYGQEADTDQLTSGSGLNHDFNYVRNSVKATVDAYDGTVTLYIVDDEDPIIRAYDDAFPDLFTDGDEMSDDLREHLRYPEDLFRIQTAAYGRYHLEDPEAFFDQDDAWRVARDPGTAGADPTTPVTDEQGQLTGEQRAPRIAPVLPAAAAAPGRGGHADRRRRDGADAAVRARTATTTPTQLLTAFMAARMDGDNYGELVVYEIASERAAARPRHRRGQHRADEDVSVLRNRLDAPGIRGAPRQPAAGPHRQRRCSTSSRSTWWAEGPEVPQLQQVIVAYGNEVVIDETLSGALTSLFGQQAVTQEQPAATTPRARRRRPRATLRRARPTHRHGRRAGRGAARRGRHAVRRRRRGAHRRRPGLYEDRIDRGPRQGRAGDGACWPATPTVGHDATTTTTAGPAAPGLTRRVGAGDGRPVWCFFHTDAGWSSLVARRAHNPKVVGSNPAPATNEVAGQRPFPRDRGGPLWRLQPVLLPRFLLCDTTRPTTCRHELGRKGLVDMARTSRSGGGTRSRRSARRRDRRKTSDRLAAEKKVDGDVASCGVGVGAHLVGFSDKSGGRLAVDRRQRHVERDGDREGAVAGREQADSRVDRGVTGIEALSPSDGGEGAFEARPVPDGEQLLRVRPSAWSAHLLGDAKVHLQLAVARATVAVDAPAGDTGMCRVEDLRHRGFLSWGQST